MCLLLWKDIFYISEPETAYAEGPSRFISRFRGRRNRNRKRFEGVIERNNSLLTESELDARIATEGGITNDNASLLETQTDDATLTTLLTSTEKDFDPLRLRLPHVACKHRENLLYVSWRKSKLLPIVFQ